MNRKSVMVASATAVALAGGVVVASQAHAEGGEHYVAFTVPSSGRAGVNSVKLVNAGAGGGDRCFNVSSLSFEGGPFTTTYKVYYNKLVDVSTYNGEGCKNLVGEWSVVPQWDDQKYMYVNIVQ